MLEKIPPNIGEALQNQRAGLEQTVFRRLDGSTQWPSMDVSSSAFSNGNPLPVKYTADGGGISPPLQWRGVPDDTSFVVLIVEDADSPTPHPLVHAIVVNLDPRESSMAEGALDSPDHVGVGLATGLNSFLSNKWLPPDPPPGHGKHCYVFQIFALRGPLFDRPPGRDELFSAIKENGVAAGHVIATYERSQRERTQDAATLDGAIVPA